MELPAKPLTLCSLGTHTYRPDRRRADPVRCQHQVNMRRRGDPHMQQQTAIVVGSADRFGALVVTTGKEFVKKHPAISVTWLVGLLVSILASGFTPAPEAVRNYEVNKQNQSSPQGLLCGCCRVAWKMLLSFYLDPLASIATAVKARVLSTALS